jgi:hypothetical protein
MGGNKEGLTRLVEGTPRASEAKHDIEKVGKPTCATMMPWIGKNKLVKD